MIKLSLMSNQKPVESTIFTVKHAELINQKLPEVIKIIVNACEQIKSTGDGCANNGNKTC